MSESRGERPNFGDSEMTNGFKEHVWPAEWP